MSVVALLLSILCQLSGFQAVAPSPPKLTMRVESGQTIVASGYENALLCTIEIPEGFHIYWSSPGASGTATELKVSTPEGCTIGPVRYPRPTVFHGAEGDTYGYEDLVTFIIPFSTGPMVDDVDFEVAARWLACRKICYMGQASQRIHLPVVEHVAPNPTPACERAIDAMPQPIARRAGTVVELQKHRLVVTGPVGPKGMPAFIPRDVPGVMLGNPTFHQDEQEFRLVLPFEVQPEDALRADPVVSGLLIEGAERTDPSWAITMPVPPSQEEEDPE